MIAPPQAIVDLLKPWNDFYSHSKTTVTIVTFFHIGGLLLAGGLAIAADRGTLRALRIAGDRSHYTRELHAVHRWVITGLVVVVLSGLAMLASDFETFWGSPIFWIKMTLVLILLLNGFGMTRAEAMIERDASESSPGWAALRRTAISSLVLWFVIAALGIALVNFS